MKLNKIRFLPWMEEFHFLFWFWKNKLDVHYYAYKYNKINTKRFLNYSELLILIREEKSIYISQ